MRSMTSLERLLPVSAMRSLMSSVMPLPVSTVRSMMSLAAATASCNDTHCTTALATAAQYALCTAMNSPSHSYKETNTKEVQLWFETPPSLSRRNLSGLLSCFLNVARSEETRTNADVSHRSSSAHHGCSHRKPAVLPHLICQLCCLTVLKTQEDRLLRPNTVLLVRGRGPQRSVFVNRAHYVVNELHNVALFRKRAADIWLSSNCEVSHSPQRSGQCR